MQIIPLSIPTPFYVGDVNVYLIKEDPLTLIDVGPKTKEAAAALKLLRPGGLILLHDFYPQGRPLYPGGDAIVGPDRALQRVRRECPEVSVLPLGALPWPTKDGSNMTSLALVAKAS